MVGVLNVNPCVDKTVFVEEIRESSVMICEKTNIHSGGKGVNVARVLKNLGCESIIFSVLAGETGRQLERMMAEEGLDAHSVWVEGLSRTYTTVIDKSNRQLALKERGPSIDAEKVKGIKKEFMLFLEKIDFLCVSDTISCEGMVGFSAWAVRKAHEKGIKVLLDTDNEALLLALLEKPDFVKPNNDELTAIIGEKSDKEYVEYLQGLGIEHPIVTFGEKGCLSCENGRFIRVLPPQVETVSAVGCGDSFIGGLIYSVMCGKEWIECLKYASAAGAANAMDWRAAYIEKKTVEGLAERVKTELI